MTLPLIVLDLFGAGDDVVLQAKVYDPDNHEYGEAPHKEELYLVRNPDDLESVIRLAPPWAEVSIASSIVINRRHERIMQLDFKTQDEDDAWHVLDQLSWITPAHNWKLYRTDHSFHGWLYPPLQDREWYRLMELIQVNGIALKDRQGRSPLNSPHMNSLIDSAWVSVSLINNSSALRITGRTQGRTVPQGPLVRGRKHISLSNIAPPDAQRKVKVLK